MSEDRFSATPTLIIGIGGTGLKVATYVKKSLLEANRNRLPQRMAILVLDTEKDIKCNAGGWGSKRTEHHATGPVSIEGGEYAPLVGNVRDLGVAIKNEQLQAGANPQLRQGQAHRHMSSWFQAQYYIDEANIPEAVWNLDVGAGRFRQFGRLGLFSHVSTLTTLLGSVLQAIHHMGATQIYVHVAGSLAGGTGAALFVDVAHLVKELRDSAGFTQEPVIFGHFVLAEGFRGTPQVQLSNPGVRADFDARCYAAVRELERLQGPTNARIGYPMVYDPSGVGFMNARMTQSPYTAVYLYDGDRQNNPVNGREIEAGLAPAIADAIAGYVDDRSGGAFCSHSVNYRAFYPAYNIRAGQVTYGSVGTYTIELPIYHITEGWAHDLAVDALDVLLAPAQRDSESGVPLRLTADQPAGEASDPQSVAENWLKTSSTLIVQQLTDWGTLAGRTSTLRQQAVDAVLMLDAGGWQQKLAPSDASWRAYVAESQTELEGSLRNSESAKYFVDHRQPGTSAEEKASNLEEEIDRKLKLMVGESREVWLRAGGDFRSALVRLGNHHVQSFDKALQDWLLITLNGDPNVGAPAQRKQGKLGYVGAFLEHVDGTLKDAARVLSEATAQSKTKRRPMYDAIDGARKEAANKMRRSGGFRGVNLREYRDRSDELAQFHKADIARQVAYDLLERLQTSVEQALNEVGRWERILGVAKAPEGGAYALVMQGRREVLDDRQGSRNAVRWVIADDEAGDEYISEKRDQYSRDKLDDLLAEVEWKVGRTDGSGPLRIEFTLDDRPWDRLAGAVGQQARGARSVSLLLEKCRSVYEVAWSDMSVAAYLIQNYNHRIDEMAQRVFENSGYLLANASPTGQPPMRTTFMRVCKDNLPDNGAAFLTRLRDAVAQKFQETTSAAQRADANRERDYLSASGENSRDRFKLTFVMFGDLLRAEEIRGLAQARVSYHTVSSRGSDWKTLHIFPAETHALQIERRLSSGPQARQQKRRELSDEVVTVLEDLDRFRLAMRCLAYGTTDYHWGIGGELGVLLHRYTPPQSVNPAGLSYWRLTVAPTGSERGGVFYTSDGRLAAPEHYQLSAMASEPDLLHAFIQLVCVGASLGDHVPIDWVRVESTIQAIMSVHRQQWDSRDMRWRPTEQSRNRAQLMQEARDKAAQSIRLSALIAEADEKLGAYRWAWAPASTERTGLDAEERVKVQRYVDLWTALRGVAQEELENLGQRLGQLGAWGGEIPRENLELQSDVASETETGEEPVDSPEVLPSERAEVVDGGWVCSQGHRNADEDEFCLTCGAPRPQMPPPAEAEEIQVCEDGHEMPPEAAFCPKCGKPPKAEELEQVRVCENGHEMSPDAAFCPKCGKPPKVDEPEQVRVCENGHEMPPDAAFCPKCGKPPKAEEREQVCVCEDGHEMPPDAAFCPLCGRPPR